MNGHVRGPETGGRECHVNVQVASGLGGGLNYHVGYDHGQYIWFDSHQRVSSGADAAIVAAELAGDAAADFTARTVGEEYGEVWDWYYNNVIGRLYKLAELSGAT